MNLIQLVLKQMRQRALSTWLTLLSVLLGSTLAIGVIILQRESGNVFVQTDFGYDVLVGVKGSPMQLVLNTIYHVDVSPGNVPYVLYESLRNDRSNVKFAVPYVVGDTYKGHRVVGTSPVFFGFDEQGKPLEGWDERGHLKAGFAPPPAAGEQADGSKPTAASTFEYRLGRRFTLAQGRLFDPRKFEAVIGSEVAEKTGLKLGDKFKAAHDAPGAKASELDEHDEQWEVVGILGRTGTAEDRVLFIPLISFYAIPQHEKSLADNYAAKTGAPAPAAKAPAASKPASGDGKHEEAGHHDHEEAYELNPDGTIDLKLTKDKWQVSAILVRARSNFAGMLMQDTFRRGDLAMAVNPASVMREFFNTFLKPSTLVLMIVVLVVVISAAVSILVSIYNAVAARSREIAIMRALGATRGKVLTLICVEAGMVGLVGGLIGIVIGHAIGAVISTFFEAKMGTGINWVATSWQEWVYLGGVVILAVLAGLVPGLKAYRTPVAMNLVAA